MVRTQIYLTEKERIGLKMLSAQVGKKQSELIREAIDNFLLFFSRKGRLSQLRKAKGMWKGRSNNQFTQLRKEINNRDIR